VPPSGQTDQSFYKHELPSKAKGDLRLELDHIPNGRYRLITYGTGYQRNDAFTAYLRMGSPNQLTKEQVRDLQAVSSGVPLSSEEVTVGNHSFSKTVPLRANDVYLFELLPAPANGH
jgi:xylan 1,4-beta-xylosidase